MVDKTGVRKGKLTAVSYAGKDKRGKHYWLCKCDCGNYTTVRSDALAESSTTYSCGCYSREWDRSVINRKHGMTKTKIHNVWCGIKGRCYCKSNTRYKYYGGRGIRVCDEWRADFVSFYEWAMKHGFSDGMTVDRIDVNGDYRPDNCRLVTIKEQANNRRNNRMVLYKGKLMTIAELSEISGVSYGNLHRRIRTGWTVEDAADTPIKKIQKGGG